MHEATETQTKQAETRPVTSDDPVIVDNCPTCISGVDATVTAPEFAEALTQDL